jgi:aminoglycoside 3-N-acetyltransferase
MKFTQFLKSYFSSVDLHKNDKLLLHSNMKNLYRSLKKLKYEFKTDDILSFLIDFLGNNGTLILPTFNFDFCNKGNYSCLKSKSQVGALSEAARIKAKRNKTWHPVYSFVLFGNIPKDEVLKSNYSALGADSIFNWLTNNNGKIGIIDLSDQNSMTFYHHVEELMHANWRFHKEFIGKYEDFNNVIAEIKTKIFVRKLEENVKTDVIGMEKILWSKNIYSAQHNNSHKGFRIAKAKDIKTEVEKIIREGNAEGILYKKN